MNLIIFGSMIFSFFLFNNYSSELQNYSNIIFLIHTLKKFLQVLIIISQIDVAFISIISSQISGMIFINFLLNEKSFDNKIKLTNYNSIGENTPLYNKVTLQV